MYGEGKKLEYRSNRRRQRNRKKKLMMGLIAVLIAIPTILCTVMVVKAFFLKEKVDDILDKKDEYENTTEYKGENGSNIAEVSTDNQSEIQTTSDGQTIENQNTEQQTAESQSGEETTEEQTTEEQTTQEQATTKPVVDPLPDGKYAYLTFDDGPSSNTYPILDILDNYGVKATFFVNGHTGSAMEERYKAIVDRGHAIGIHTYTHDYDNVYGGLDKFQQEIESLRKYILDVTGTDTTLFRFPGGSSNTIADDIKPYITWLNENGYSYWDWNSSSGDATSKKPTAAEIVENCMVQADAGYKNLVILMHDLTPKDTTVEALPALIEALQVRGYQIIAISDRSTPVQHRKVQ